MVGPPRSHTRMTVPLISKSNTQLSNIFHGSTRHVERRIASSPVMDPVDGDRVVLIADGYNRRVVLWTEGALEGVVRARTRGEVSAVALDEDGAVLVAVPHHVERWAPGESYGTVIAGGHGCGGALNQLSSPRAILRDPCGALLVLNGRGDSVVRWAAGASEGEVIAGGNGRAGDLFNGVASLNQLHAPNDMALAPDGSLVVVEACTRRVVKWSPGAAEGTIIAPAPPAVLQETLRGMGGETLDRFWSPMAVSFDGEESLIITDHHNHRVIRWTLGEPAGVVIAGGKGKGPLLSQLAFPSDAVLDEDGSVVVADRLNHRIMRWAPGASEGILLAGGNGCGAQLNQLEQGDNKIALGVWKAWNMQTHMLFPSHSRSLVRWLLLCDCHARRQGLFNLGSVLVNELLAFVVPARLAPSGSPAGVPLP